MMVSTKLGQREQDAVAAVFAWLVNAAGASRSFLSSTTAGRREESCPASAEWAFVDRSLTRC